MVVFVIHTREANNTNNITVHSNDVIFYNKCVNRCTTFKILEPRFKTYVLSSVSA